MKKLLLGDKDVSGILKFNGDHVNVPFSEPISINYLISAAGGGGGSGEDQLLSPFLPGGGGGGAGGIITGSTDIFTLQYYDVVIGEGGRGGAKGASRNGDNGEDSTFIGLTAIGGGGGGNGQGGSVPECDRIYGRDGGSGGGAGAHPLYTACATGSGLQPSSTDGGLGNDGFAYGDGSAFSGGGGGAGGPATSQTGGTSYVWPIDGNSYGAGGNAASSPSNNTLKGSGGFGGATDEDGEPGIDGVVIISYDAPIKASGGTITESGGKVFHTFESSSVFFPV